MDRRALIQCPLCADVSAVAVDDTLHRCQPDSGAWKLLGAMQALKDAKHF